MPSRTKSAAIAGPTFGRSSSIVMRRRLSVVFIVSPALSAADQTHRDAFDGKTLSRVDGDRREVGIFRHQQHFTPAPFQPFDSDFLTESRDDDLPRARFVGLVHGEEIAVDDPGILHRLAAYPQQVIGARSEELG